MARTPETCEHGVVGKTKCLTCSRFYSRKYGRSVNGRRQRKAWKDANLSKVHASQRKAVYGITPDEYADLLTKQENRCAMVDCRTSTPGGRGTWHVDHDHEGGVVRGLLCNTCNLRLGQYEQSLKRVEAFTQYLTASLNRVAEQRIR